MTNKNETQSPLHLARRVLARAKTIRKKKVIEYRRDLDARSAKIAALEAEVARLEAEGN